MNLKSLNDLNLDNQTVILRTDFDVPMENGKIADDTRIKDGLGTINYLLSKNCRIIIISHLDRPKGVVNPALSLKPIAFHLQELFPQNKVFFSAEITTPAVNQFLSEMQPREILVLENLRFDPREESNNDEFAKQLASLGKFFINEAFAVSYRPHASIVGIPKYLPTAFGFEFRKESEILSNVKEQSQRPIVVILGGKKEDKLKFVEPFSAWADQVLIGGYLPRAGKKEGLTEGKVVYASLTTDGKDITLESAEKFTEIILTAKTIVWNGTMDLFEDRHNQAGTRIIASAIVESPWAKKYAGGGDTGAAIAKLNLTDKFDFVSAGGGSMLEMVAFGKIAGMIELM